MVKATDILNSCYITLFSFSPFPCVLGTRRRYQDNQHQYFELPRPRVTPTYVNAPARPVSLVAVPNVLITESILAGHSIVMQR